MNSAQVERFLDTYRQLENAADQLVGSGSRSSSVARLARLPEFAKYRDELDYARQVRNLLTHEAKINGQYGVCPSQQLQSFLEKMVKQVEAPPVVYDIMTPFSHMLPAHTNQKVLPLMEQMKQRGISHVPILEGTLVVGMFSYDTVFQWILDSNPPFDATTTLAHLAAYLPLNQHMGQEYRFVDPQMLVSTAKDVFEKAYDRNNKVKLLLVTRGGTRQGKLLGVVSPYDVLEDE